MNQNKYELTSDPFDWMATAITVLAMYRPGGEFADSELPTDGAGRPAICFFHKGGFITIHIGVRPD